MKNNIRRLVNIFLILFVVTSLSGCSVFKSDKVETKANDVKISENSKTDEANKKESVIADNLKQEKAIEGEDIILEKEENSKDSKTPKSNITLMIDKSDYTLKVLDNEKVITEYPVAVGKNLGQKQKSGDLKTPTGDFFVDEIIDSSYWTHDFGDGKGVIKGAYGPWFISLNTGGWVGIGIHGTHDPNSIGTRASEGCIRMNNKDVESLKKIVNVGTKVKIQE